VIPLRFFTLTAWQEGAMLGLLLFMRIMAAVTFATLLAFSTPMIEILETLRLWRVPGVVIDIADMMYRYVFIIQDTAHAMHRAQLCRMGESAPWSRRVGDIGRLASSVLIKSLDRSTRIYQAMLSRGYNETTADMRFFTAPISHRDKSIAGTGVLVMLALAIANLRWR
jgi:cobalt/nickel transport system permease protein